MATIKELLDSVPEPMQKAMFEELKGKYESKPAAKEKPTKEEIDNIMKRI